MKHAKGKYSLKSLYKNSVLFTQSLALIHKQASYRTIRKYLNSKGFMCSLGTVQHLVKRVEYAHKNHVPIDKIIDKRSYNKKKKSLKDVAKEGKLKMSHLDSDTRNIVNSSIKNAKKDVDNMDILPRSHYYSVRQVLDLQIQQYYDALRAHDVGKSLPRYGEKAIEMELKYKGDDALSLAAVKQYNLISQARFKATAEVATELLPPDLLKKFADKVNKVTNAVVAKTQISPDGKRLYNALKKDGIKIGKED